MTIDANESATLAIGYLEAVAHAFSDAGLAFMAAGDQQRSALCHSAQQRLIREARDLAAHLLEDPAVDRSGDGIGRRRA